MLLKRDIKEVIEPGENLEDQCWLFLTYTFVEVRPEANYIRTTAATAASVPATTGSNIPSPSRPISSVLTGHRHVVRASEVKR